jgi:BlaI family penicillinase repressor
MNKRLADSEWVLLKALWGRPPQTMKQIVSCIQEEQPKVDWSYKTYHTYLRNMCKKGLLHAEERNLKDKLYSPLVSQDEAVKAESDSLLSRRNYFGSVGRLVLSMADNGQLTERDKRELLKLANRLRNEAEDREE